MRTGKYCFTKKALVTKYVQNVHLVDKCVCVQLTFLTEPVLSQQKSQLRDVCGLPLPIDDQANQFLAKFSTIFFILFVSNSYKEIPESVIKRHSLLIPINL